ncbi:MAG: tRNA glutamyl-Q(34) synthetase GluQRS [Phycisphaerae bacterium]|nr:tRNA glutamyl-Q(34) synthetase GluQRS [Phycisphaerae bacterium]
MSTQAPNPLPTPVTRLAPSPTGALHLGNARTFLANWALARQRGWRIVLRIEDLDTPRVKHDAASGILGTLRWLGLDWDDGPFVQSSDLEPYREAMRSLAGGGLVYPSSHTRSEVEDAAAGLAASAPQEGSHESPFPRALRPPLAVRAFDDPACNWRFATPDGGTTFDDLFAGRCSFRLADSIGDFIVWTKRACPAYQLAVVVDDHRQGVTHVVRGDDLLDSAARQLLLYRALGPWPEPAHAHLPLVIGADGRRLAKRHGDTRLETYRSAGVPPEAVVGLVAFWCGIRADRATCSLAEFRAAFKLDSIPRRPIVFRQEDHQWLLSRCAR